MGAALRTEYRKLVTTRLWWVLLLVMVVYMAFLSAVMAWAVSQGAGTGPAVPGGPGGAEGGLDPSGVVRTVYTIAVTFGYAFPLVVGTLAVTTEFRHRTVTPTFLLEPRRDVVLVAKLVVGAAAGVLFGVVGTAASAGTGALVLGLLGEPTGLDDAGTWGTLALSALALAVWAVVGVALGTVLTNQVAAVVVILAFTQFLEPVLRVVLGLTSWGQDVARYLPGAAGEAISGGSFYSEAAGVPLLPAWQGLLVLLGYAVVLAALGRLTTLRRDVG
ncbi:ABC transporter permease subunit [Cellulomonas sp. JZ18]|uniref:ABC transporter permease subunit n=1 Tax=Cellulomonas sp. JZ18 TaxID=2654191 RepID=UPI0012D42E68|nr:ABC transporter permease subunit [Cellulomonas sp. JZ18]QGQ19886.1 ABC transporter permease subunit [Cellulomonas sp. JZ18]